ncbi:LOW QUALITY PROTEIN: hypothetical protein Q4I28_000959 [Leishmania naiffi]|uniref:Uncharacterized protein n=1 Tax=Leishmania naiffi TaxID=5678 RepID=A0AAW3C5N4_9TRYP
MCIAASVARGGVWGCCGRYGDWLAIRTGAHILMVTVLMSRVRRHFPLPSHFVSVCERVCVCVCVRVRARVFSYLPFTLLSPVALLHVRTCALSLSLSLLWFALPPSSYRSYIIITLYLHHPSHLCVRDGGGSGDDHTRDGLRVCACVPLCISLQPSRCSPPNATSEGIPHRKGRVALRVHPHLSHLLSPSAANMTSLPPPPPPLLPPKCCLQPLITYLKWGRPVMRSAAAAAAPPSTIAVGAALLPMNDLRTGMAPAALPRDHDPQSTRPAATSPSPPMPTCRRLSYNSAKTGSSSRSRTRASPSSVASSHSCVHPPSQQQSQKLQHFWQKPVPIAEVATTTASLRSTTAAARATVIAADTCAIRHDSPLAARSRSPSIRIGSAASPCLPEAPPFAATVAVAASAICAVACSTKSGSGDTAALSHMPTDGRRGGATTAVGSGSTSPPSATIAQAVTATVIVKHRAPVRAKGPSLLSQPSLSSAAVSPHAAAPRPLPARHHSTGTITLASSGLPVAQPQPQRAAPPPQRRRSRSASSGVCGAGTNPNNVYFQPAPTLRNVGAGDPSPFSAGQLAMPRRSPQWPAVAPALTVAATTTRTVQQRAPPVQLVRPAELHRSATMVTRVAAAAQDLLQPPHRSKLTRTLSVTSVQQRRRTPSTGSFDGGSDSARNTEPVAPVSLFTRRASVSSLGAVAEAPVGRSIAPTASRRPRLSTASGPHSTYTARGAKSGGSPAGHIAPWSPNNSATDFVAASNNTAEESALLRKDVVRSSSAPAHKQRHARSSSRTSSAVPGNLTSQASRTADGCGALAAAPPLLVRSASVSSAHQRQPHTSTDNPVGVVATAASGPATVSTSFVRTSLVPRRSQSRNGTSGTARSGATGKNALTSLGTAAVSMTARVPNVNIDVTARRANPGATRPTIDSTAGAGDPCSRPLASTEAGLRRLASRKPRDGGSKNTVSASQSSMIEMEESKAFLQEFQRMNERELALFGTLLATVASEQQKHCDLGIAGGAALGADKADDIHMISNAAGDRAAGITPSTGVVVSAEDVTVWACKRAVSLPIHQQQRQSKLEQTSGMPPPTATPGKPEAVAPSHLHADDELIVLVRRSHSCTASLHAPPSSSMSGSEAQQLQTDQLTQRTDGTKGQDDAHLVASPPAAVRPPPHQQQQQGIVVDTAAGSRSRCNATALHRASRSPSPAPPPLVNTAHGKENDLQTLLFNSASSTSVPASSLPTPTCAQAHPGTTRVPQQQQQQVGMLASACTDMSGSGGLRPRAETYVNTSANRIAAGAAWKSTVEAMSTSTRTVRKELPFSTGAAAATAGTVRRGMVRDGPSSAAAAAGRIRGGGQRRCSANNGKDASPSPPEQQRQCNAEGYANIIRRYIPNGLEESRDGNDIDGCDTNLKEGGVPFDEDPHSAGTSASSLSRAASEASAPLAALKKAKEMAAELAAAARTKTIAADKYSAAMMPTPFLSPSIFSFADSPTSGSASMGRASGVATPLGRGTEISGVRVTAAQLQLLIDGSRSQANYARYQPL